MERTRTIRIAAVLALALVASTAAARADILHVNGTLQGEGVPNGYTFELAVLAAPQAGPVIEVVGKSCTGTPSWLNPFGCQRATALFAIPPVLQVAQGKVFYHADAWHLTIGDVIGIGNVKWVRLRKGASIEATLTAARLRLDTEKLSAGRRMERFEQLHGRR